MTYQPIVPTGGLLGWQYINRTLDRQMESFGNSAVNLRDTEYFKEAVGSVQTASDLVSDRRLLRVALGAFGLQDDIDSKAFIQKVLEEGTESPSALANKLTDDRYTSFARAFGFGNAIGAQTARQGFAEDILSKYLERQFEVAVGTQDDDLRLALNAKREVGQLASQETSEDTKWYLVLGTPPVRAVFERALALPTAFGQIDLEQQVETLKDLTERRLGVSSIKEFSDEGNLEKLVQRFLLQSQIANSNAATSSQSIALTLLSS